MSSMRVEEEIDAHGWQIDEIIAIRVLHLFGSTNTYVRHQSLLQRAGVSHQITRNISPTFSRDAAFGSPLVKGRIKARL